MALHTNTLLCITITRKQSGFLTKRHVLYLYNSLGSFSTTELGRSLRNGIDFHSACPELLFTFSVSLYQP